MAFDSTVCLWDLRRTRHPLRRFNGQTQSLTFGDALLSRESERERERMTALNLNQIDGIGTPNLMRADEGLGKLLGNGGNRGANDLPQYELAADTKKQGYALKKYADAHEIAL